MIKYQHVFKWLLAIYGGSVVLYLLNLATPPNNMPIFVVMAIVAVVALGVSRSKKKVVTALLLVAVALVMIVKEHSDGIALKEKLDKVREQQTPPRM